MNCLCSSDLVCRPLYFCMRATPLTAVSLVTCSLATDCWSSWSDSRPSFRVITVQGKSFKELLCIPCYQTKFLLKKNCCSRKELQRISLYSLSRNQDDMVRNI